MFYGVVVKPGQTVTLSPEDGGEVLHLSQVCMPHPKDGGRTYVQVTQEGKTYSVCMLQKDKQEFTSLDLFLSTSQGITIKTEGAKNEVHLTGYFEPEPEDFDSEDEEDESDMEESVMHHAKKHVPSKGGKIEDLDGDVDEEDDEDEDEDEAEMKALTGGDDDEDDEDDDDEDEDDEDGENCLGGDDEEVDEEDDDDEDEDEDDEEEDESPQAKKGADKKRKAIEAASPSNKKAKPSAAPAKGQAPQKAGSDAAAYKSALVEFLKKNGKTPLATLGQKVKKPAGVSEKMAQFLKSNASTFDVSNGVCSLK
ncbi:nuclear factor NF3 [Besnoitia besnoiti]|uniref:Nuclear factor NF3 n=1 Tax=Besnoitia besnoiti TaxID=94643 RepID=A0A2A9MAJ8_BESBE|nr:nuclear factor NF3 [Besnoitia besnoiti]PFH33331.1 nuclear factor NF3 [Besnoitia besnoiti]